MSIDYSKKRYWYHFSSSFKKVGEFVFYPWGLNDKKMPVCNRDPAEPKGNRIPVAPSYEQCLTALQLLPYCKFNIYRTKKKVIAKEPVDIFDSSITHEGWIEIPTLFVRVGTLDMQKINTENISDAAVIGLLSESKETLNEWKKLNVIDHIQFSKNYDYLDL